MAKSTPVSQLRERLGLDVPTFAEQVGVSERTVHRWQGKHSGPSPLAKQRMRELHQAHQKAQATHASGPARTPQRTAAAPPPTAPGRPGITPSRVPLRLPDE